MQADRAVASVYSLPTRLSAPCTPSPSPSQETRQAPPESSSYSPASPSYAPTSPSYSPTRKHDQDNKPEILAISSEATDPSLPSPAPDPAPLSLHSHPAALSQSRSRPVTPIPQDTPTNKDRTQAEDPAPISDKGGLIDVNDSTKGVEKEKRRYSSGSKHSRKHHSSSKRKHRDRSPKHKESTVSSVNLVPEPDTASNLHEPQVQDDIEVIKEHKGQKRKNRIQSEETELEKQAAPSLLPTGSEVGQKDSKMEQNRSKTVQFDSEIEEIGGERKSSATMKDQRNSSNDGNMQPDGDPKSKKKRRKSQEINKEKSIPKGVIMLEPDTATTTIEKCRIEENPMFEDEVKEVDSIPKPVLETDKDSSALTEEMEDSELMASIQVKQ